LLRSRRTDVNTITDPAAAPGPVGGSVGREDEQTRARSPDREGYIERDGVRVFYEVYGSSEPTVLLLP
jgi:hypothetical protein